MHEENKRILPKLFPLHVCESFFSSQVRGLSSPCECLWRKKEFYLLNYSPLSPKPYPLLPSSPSLSLYAFVLEARSTVNQPPILSTSHPSLASTSPPTALLNHAALLDHVCIPCTALACMGYKCCNSLWFSAIVSS